MSQLNNLTGAEVSKGIHVEESGSILLTDAGISFYQLLSIRQALQLQMRGMRLSRKLPQGTTLARRMLGFRGNKESLLEQVEELIARIQNERESNR